MEVRYLTVCQFLIVLFLCRYCKKPLTAKCTIQIATPGEGGDSTPRPVPCLAATFCPDKESLLLVFGNSLQPIIERVVCKAIGNSDVDGESKCEAYMVTVSICILSESNLVLY